ncbi:MAG: type II secretion system F family protein [Gemmatimonadales bacterium]
MTMIASLMLIAVFAGLAIAAYTYLTELSRRNAAEQAIGGFESTEIRRKITRQSDVPADSLQGRILKRAPSVWAKSADVQQKLIHAGFDSPTAPLTFSMARVATLIALPLAAFFVVPQTSFKLAVMLVGIAAMFGFLLPPAYVARAARVRQEKIRRALPDALDLLVVCVEAGISLDAAILRVAKDLVHAHTDLATELAIVNRKTNAGVRREEALRGLWERTGVDDVRTLVASLIQSEKWGSSSARVLRVSSETLRRKRRQSAEKRAAVAPNKMTIPLALLIFPALFVVILGPAMINIKKAFLTN